VTANVGPWELDLRPVGGKTTCSRTQATERIAFQQMLRWQLAYQLGEGSQRQRPRSSIWPALVLSALAHLALLFVVLSVPPNRGCGCGGWIWETHRHVVIRVQPNRWLKRELLELDVDQQEGPVPTGLMRPVDARELLEGQVRGLLQERGRELRRCIRGRTRPGETLLIQIDLGPGGLLRGVRLLEPGPPRGGTPCVLGLVREWDFPQTLGYLRIAARMPVVGTPPRLSTPPATAAATGATGRRGGYRQHATRGVSTLK
jgi:hypothetical protein